MPRSLLILSALATLLAGLMGMTGPEAQAASFDCAAAAGPTEQAVCGDPGLSARDDAVGVIQSWAAAHRKHGKLFDDPVEWRADLKGQTDAAALAELYNTHIGEMFDGAGHAKDLGQLYRRADGIVILQIVPLKDGWFAYHLHLRLKRGFEIFTYASGVGRLTDGEALDLSSRCHLAFRQQAEDSWQVEESGDCVNMMTMGGRVIADLSLAGTYRRLP